MAIDANRIKYNSNLSSIFSLLWAFLKKLSILGICFLALQLLHLSPSDRISTTTLELSGKIMSTGIKVYDEILKPVHYFLDQLYLLTDLKTENIELKMKLEKYKQIETTAQLLESENSELRKIVKAIPDKKYKSKIARILSISLNPFSKTLLIGAGSSDGVGSDYLVAGENGVIGRVIQVSENYSKVILINDLNSRIPVISSITHERAILTGDGDKLTLNYLADPKTVQEDEILLTSGDGNIFPYGIPVAEVTKNDGGRITLKPMMNLNQLEFVNVYTPTRL